MIVAVHVLEVAPPVAIGISDCWVGATRAGSGCYFLAIGQPVAVGIDSQRIRRKRDFKAIGETIVVGVRIERIGAVEPDLRPVGGAAVVGVGIERVGGRDEELLAVEITTASNMREALSRAPGVVIRTPSAMVGGGSMVTRSPLRIER